MAMVRTPAFNVIRDKVTDKVIIEVAAPGYNKSDLYVSQVGTNISIKTVDGYKDKPKNPEDIRGFGRPEFLLRFTDTGQIEHCDYVDGVIYVTIGNNIDSQLKNLLE
jgi:HSP20 family molecular chaperone IbpA